MQPTAKTSKTAKAKKNMKDVVDEIIDEVLDEVHDEKVNDVIKMKTCNTCNQEKSMNEFYSRGGKCKQCESNIRKAKDVVKQDGMKLCPRCNIEKSRDEFSPDRSRADGCQAYCKICKQEQTKLRNQKNKNELKETGVVKVVRETKICKNINCDFNGKEQPINNFSKDSTSIDGRQTYCKKCVAKRLAERSKKYEAIDETTTMKNVSHAIKNSRCPNLINPQMELMEDQMNVNHVVRFKERIHIMKKRMMVQKFVHYVKNKRL